MQLGGDEERVNRVGEQQKVCRTQGILSFSKALFHRMNPGTDMQVIKVNFLEMFFDEQDSLKCNAVFSGWGTIDDEYVHFYPPLVSLDGLTTMYFSELGAHGHYITTGEARHLKSLMRTIACLGSSISVANKTGAAPKRNRAEIIIFISFSV
jgi:hypothetical protein